MNNSVTVVGYVGQDPRIKTFGDTGNKLVKFTVAVKEHSSNSDNEKTLWFDVDAWNGLAERVLKTITKGREVVLYGRLGMSTYSKEVDGTLIQVTKPIIKLTSFHLCGPKPADQQEADTEESRSDSSKKRLTTVKA